VVRAPATPYRNRDFATLLSDPSAGLLVQDVGDRRMNVFSILLNIFWLANCIGEIKFEFR